MVKYTPMDIYNYRIFSNGIEKQDVYLAVFYLLIMNKKSIKPDNLKSLFDAAVTILKLHPIPLNLIFKKIFKKSNYGLPEDTSMLEYFSMIGVSSESDAISKGKRALQRIRVNHFNKKFNSFSKLLGEL